MDSDGSHHPEFLKSLYSLKDEYDVVMASRYIEGGFTENNKSSILMSRIVNWGYAVILNLNFKDISNSFKIYDAKLIKNLNLRCENFDIVEEILYKVVRLNKIVKVKEIPFSFKQRMFGETKRNLLIFIFAYVFTLIRLRLLIRK